MKHMSIDWVWLLVGIALGYFAIPWVLSFVGGAKKSA